MWFASELIEHKNTTFERGGLWVRTNTHRWKTVIPQMSRTKSSWTSSLKAALPASMSRYSLFGSLPSDPKHGERCQANPREGWNLGPTAALVFGVS